MDKHADRLKATRGNGNVPLNAELLKELTKGEETASEPDRDPESDGRGNSRTQLFSLLITDDEGEMWLVPYSAIHAAKAGKRRGDSFRFRFMDADADMREVEIKAAAGKLDEFVGVIDRLAAGKREYLKPGEILASVSIKVAP